MSAHDRQKALERYRETYRAFLTDDGVIDADERDRLEEIAQSEGLSVDDLNAIHERVGQDQDVRVRLAQLQAEDPAYQVYHLLDTRGSLSQDAIVAELGEEDEVRWKAALEDLLFDYHVIAVGAGAERLFYTRDSVISQVVDTLVSGGQPLTRVELLERARLPEALWEIIVASLHAWGMVETLESERGLLYGLTPSYLVYEILSYEGPLTESQLVARLGSNGQMLWQRALADPYFHEQLCNLGESVGFALLEPMRRRVLRLLEESEGLTREELVERLGWGEEAWAALKEYVLDTELVATEIGELAVSGTRYRVSDRMT